MNDYYGIELEVDDIVCSLLTSGYWKVLIINDKQLTLRKVGTSKGTYVKNSTQVISYSSGSYVCKVTESNIDLIIRESFDKISSFHQIFNNGSKLSYLPQAFAEWILKQELDILHADKRHANRWASTKIGGLYYTTDELFEIYLKGKEQIND